MFVTFLVFCVNAKCVMLKALFHSVSRKSANHYWFIDFNAWRYFTPRRDVISYDKQNLKIVLDYVCY